MEFIRGNGSILDNFFDEQTMSVHFKENVHIFKKEGKPGNWQSQTLQTKPTKDYLLSLIDQIFDEVGQGKGFLEIDRKNSKVIQLGPYRIVIVLPPLSNGIEITIVKPVKKLDISDYNLDKNLLKLFSENSHGILISGSPGEGKTTFAQAVIDFFVSQNKIIKTIESPRDLLVKPEVTQYSFSHALHSEVKDILLLSRPDYTVYDEVRNIEDFLLFKDLRLAGIGLVGVIHATNPVDSIQRFLGTIEMGIIPQIVDTIIFIKGGEIKTVLKLESVVKTPLGMLKEDLARPVILVKDFFTGDVQYEIYTYGDQVVVMPIDKIQSTVNTDKITSYGIKYLTEIFEKRFSTDMILEANGPDSIKIYVGQSDKGKIIGKGGDTITKIENELGISISVKDISEYQVENYDIKIDINQTKKSTVIKLPFQYRNMLVAFLCKDKIYKFETDSSGNIFLKDKKTTSNIQNHGIKIIKIYSF